MGIVVFYMCGKRASPTFLIFFFERMSIKNAKKTDVQRKRKPVVVAIIVSCMVVQVD
jgi:hypothetical protein